MVSYEKILLTQKLKLILSADMVSEFDYTSKYVRLADFAEATKGSIL